MGRRLLDGRLVTTWLSKGRVRLGRLGEGRMQVRRGGDNASNALCKTPEEIKEGSLAQRKNGAKSDECKQNFLVYLMRQGPRIKD